jgi:ferric-dicitrate binding protein FerR (iron transport regulator)
MAIPGRIADLIVKYHRDEITPGELIELQEWVNSSEKNKRLLDSIKSEENLQGELQEYEESKKLVWNTISRQIENEKDVSIRPRKYRRIIVAAAGILILVAGSTFFLVNSSRINDAPIAIVSLDSIMPAHEKAVLTLADGVKIFVDDVQNGFLMNEAGVNIIKQENGEIKYQADYSTKNNLSYNTFSTAKGRQYHLVLSDGTDVWLNAASSISYPVQFNNSERRVSITGEVYFEVTSQLNADNDGGVPFIVDVVGKGEVQVLGTHFNINAYSDESLINTTLLEGSVRFNALSSSQSILLKPGQQSRLTSTGLLKLATDIDTDEVMAWKNGDFNFRSADIGVILRQAARWYDIEVEYSAALITEKFTGTISRNASLGDFLKILSLSQVKFKFANGKRLTIL